MKDKLFNSFIFWNSMFFGIWQACFLTFSSFFAFELGFIDKAKGKKKYFHSFILQFL